MFLKKSIDFENLSNIIEFVGEETAGADRREEIGSNWFWNAHHEEVVVFESRHESKPEILNFDK